MRYSVLLSPGAERDLGALDKPVQRRVVARIEALAENPRPAGVTKLQGEANAWRIRVGDYRVLYAIDVFEGAEGREDAEEGAGGEAAGESPPAGFVTAGLLGFVSRAGVL